MQFVGDNTNKGVKELGLKAEEQKILKGYESKADTMFVARLSPLTPWRGNWKRRKVLNIGRIQKKRGACRGYVTI